MNQTDFTAGNRLFDGQPEDPFSGKGFPGEGFGNKADAETIFHNGNDQVRRGQFDVRFRQRVTVFENIFKVPPGQGVFFEGHQGKAGKLLQRQCPAAEKGKFRSGNHNILKIRQPGDQKFIVTVTAV